MADPVSEETARNRWAVIQVMRVAGIALVIIGILMVRGVIETSPYVGYALIVIGLVDGFGMPQLLARKWRTPPQ